MTDSPNNLILPPHEGVNLAPVKPLLAIRDKNKGQTNFLCDALRERFTHYLKQDEEAWKEIYGTMGLVDRFIKGEQSLRRNVVTGEWKIWNVREQTTEAQRQINIMRFYESVAVSKWVSSNPDVRVEAGTDRDDAVESAKAAGLIVDFYEEKFFDEWFNQREGRLGLRGGTYVNRFRFDSGLKAFKLLRDIVETKDVQSQGWGNCGDCSYQGEAGSFLNSYAPSSQQTDSNVIQMAEMPACPKCGSEAVLVNRPQAMQTPSVTGQETVWMGDIVCEQRPLPCLRWDIRTRLEDSSYLIDQSRTTLGQVRALLGDVKIQGDSSDYGLDILDSLAVNKEANKRAKYYREPVAAIEFWLSRDDLADITLGQDEETVSGQVIPKGKLIDILPERICVQGFNGLNVITGIFAESHRDSYVSGVWHMNPMSGVGDGGMKDTVEPQKRLNKFDSQAMAYFGSTATPGTLFIEGAIEDKHMSLVGVPNKAIPVNLSQIPNVQKLQDALMRLPPGSLGAGFLEYAYQQLNNFAQLTSHNTSFSGGLPGVNNKTATGAQITDVNSNALYLPPLQIKGLTRKSGAKLIVDLYRKHFSIERSFPLGNKQGGRQGGKKLKGTDLSRDLVFRVVKNSEYPRSIFTQREDSTALFQMVGGAQGLIMLQDANPQLADYLTGLFGFEMPGETFDEIASLCRRRFDQMRQADQLGQVLEQIGVPNDPMRLAQAIDPPISLHEPSHTEKLKWWQEMLDTDEGQECGRALRGAMELVITEHFNFSTGQASIINAAAGVAQVYGSAPQTAVQQGQQAQVVEGQQQQLSAQNAQNEQQAREADAQRTHEAQQSQDARDHELDKIDIEHENAKELLRMQPKEKAA